MNLVVIAIGLSKIIIAAAMLVRPAQFTDRMQGYAGMTSLYVFELAMRFTLGAVLILIASDSRFPIRSIRESPSDGFACAILIRGILDLRSTVGVSSNTDSVTTDRRRHLFGWAPQPIEFLEKQEG